MQNAAFNVILGVDFRRKNKLNIGLAQIGVQKKSLTLSAVAF